MPPHASAARSSRSCSPRSTRSTAASATARRPPPQRGWSAPTVLVRARRRRRGPDRAGAADDATLLTCQTVYEAWRLRQPGEIWRRPITWRDDFGLSPDVWGNNWKGFVALHRDASGTVDGYVRYHAEDKWEDRQPAIRLIIDDLHGLSDDVEPRSVVSSSSIDWALDRARRAPLARRSDAVATDESAGGDVGDIGDGLWLKLLDVPAALEARRYERPGSLVIELDRRRRSGREGSRSRGGSASRSTRPRRGAGRARPTGRRT